MGTEELSQTTTSRAHTDTEEVSVRQASSVAPSLGDPQADHFSMIRRLIREELCTGSDLRSCCSEREDSESSPLSQEDSHSVRSSSQSRSSGHSSSARSRRTRTRSRSPCRHSSHSRATSRRSPRAGPSPRPPWVERLRHLRPLRFSSRRFSSFRLLTPLLACLRPLLHRVLCSRCFQR